MTIQQELVAWEGARWNGWGKYNIIYGQHEEPMYFQEDELPWLPSWMQTVWWFPPLRARVEGSTGELRVCASD